MLLRAVGRGCGPRKQALVAESFGEVVDPGADMSRQSLAGREDEMDDAFARVPLREEADEPAAAQRFRAGVIGQERDASAGPEPCPAAARSSPAGFRS